MRLLIHLPQLVLEQTVKLLRGVVEFTAQYFSLSSHCKVSNIQFLLMKYAQIPLLLQFSSPNLTMNAKSAETLKRLMCG